MDAQLKKALLVFGIGAGLFWLFRPSSKRKPITAKEPNKGQQLKEAELVATAYGKALKAGESPAALEELNKMMEGKYGMRVIRKQADSKYYVMDTKGNQIMKIN